MKILGISLVWLLLSGSLIVPIGFMSAYANAPGSQSVLSTTILSSSAVSTIFGNPITFTATVSPSSATGTVQFNDTSTSPPTTLGTGTISSGTATFITSSLSIGSHNIVAKYLGDVNNAPSTSSILTQSVNSVSISTTIISSSHNPSTLGQSVTFTATVSPSSATGTVQFNDSSTILGTGTISGGQATFTTSSLSIGSHNIVAKYLGDTNNSPSTSTLTQVVNPITIGTTTTILASSQNPSTISHSVTFTATVSPSTATGTVQFNDSSTSPSTILGVGAISSGQATFTTSSLSIGSHNIVAKYLGDTNDASSISTLTQTVNQISTATTTTLVSSQNPSIISHSITFTAIVSPNTATGTVQLNDSSTILGTGTISGGQATFITSSLSIGSHNIVAKYLGDTNDAVSTSSALSQTVNQISLATTTTTMVSSQNPSTTGNSITFTATVSPSTATGTVQFNDSSTILGTGTISGGQATFTTSSLSVGSHNIVAKYLGDTNDASSTSTLTQTVNQVTITSSTISLSSNTTSTIFGHSVTFTATVSPSTATGTVQFNDSSTILGTGTISGGQATFTTSSLSVGSHNIVAKYLGDTNNTPSTSAPLTHVVNQVAITSSTISLSSNTTSTIFGHSVTFTATVSPSTATGTVQLLLSGTNLGSPVALSGGHATFTTSSIPVGTYSLTASYSGDINFHPSTSNSIPISTIMIIGGSGSTPGSVGGNNDDNHDDDDHDEKNSDNDHNNGNHNGEKNADDDNNDNHDGKKNSDDGNGDHGKNDDSKQKRDHSDDKHGDD